MSGIRKGDRVRIIRDAKEHGSDWLRAGAEATVDYVLPDYGKIICVLDRRAGFHTSCCLYNSQEGDHWERIA